MSISSIFSSNKEEIRNRIIKKAQELWGIDKVFDFDPLVVLIMEVLSNELFNITNDVHNLENRIFDKISRILASDNLVAPLPAHGVIYFQPAEDNVKLGPDTHLSLKKKFGNVSSANNSAVEIDFSPLHTVDLFNGHIKYLATSRSLFEVEPNSKRVLGRATKSSHSHSIWLGISCASADRMKAYKGLSFYFSWGNYQVGREVYNLLALTKWTLNGNNVRAYKNRFMPMSSVDNETYLFERKNFMHILSQDVESYYESRFLTLDNHLDTTLNNDEDYLPLDLRQQFEASVLEKMDQKLDWIRIDFPASISDAALEELYIALNAFPVVNKRLVQSKNRLKSIRNVVPIKTEDMEQLLTIDGMLDKDGYAYSEVPYSANMHNTDVGYYTIRHGSVERLDERSAKDMVDFLFELIRDEKAAFALYNSDFLNTIMSDLDKSITLVQQKTRVTTAPLKELQNYVIVNSKNESDLMFMNVWLTYAELANGISIGTTLQLKQNTYRSHESIVFLTNTVGGRARLNRAESVQAFKYGITTADRVVSKNDIINFIRYELGIKVLRVELRNGVVMDDSVHKGFYKTIDIYIEPNATHGLREEEWNELSNQTLTKLKSRSIMEYNYRILLDNVIYA